MSKYHKKDDDFKLLDICTGTGVIALTAAEMFGNAEIKALDIVDKPFYASQKYLSQKCMSKFSGAERVVFEKCDFLDKNTWEGDWDCICSNPPYLNAEDMEKLEKQVKDFEPESALFAEGGGLIFYEYIAEFAKTH